MITRGGPSRYAAAAARVLRRGRQEAPASLPPDRRRLVAAVEHALAARARRRRAARVWGVSFAAAAAVVLSVAGAWYWRYDSGRPAVVAGAVAGRAVIVLDDPDRTGGAGAFLHGAQPTPLHRGMELPPGIRLAAPLEGEVSLGTAEGTVMTLEKAASLTVREAHATQRFVLHLGAVRVRVAPLMTGERFLIDTDDAEIEVHGTSFRVAVIAPDAACADGERTRVTVSEGVVTVRSRSDEVRLTPGSVWQSTCIVAEAVAGPRRELVPPARLTASRRRATAVTGAAEAGPVEPAPPPSVLAAQNDLFATALRAREQGRAADAVALFDRLLTEHPRSPLAESAAAQRMKLLAPSDPAAARAAAEYLRRFPRGFARQEAQALAAGTTSARPR